MKKLSIIILVNMFLFSQNAFSQRGITNGIMDAFWVKTTTNGQPNANGASRYYVPKGNKDCWVLSINITENSIDGKNTVTAVTGSHNQTVRTYTGSGASYEVYLKTLDGKIIAEGTNTGTTTSNTVGIDLNPQNGPVFQNGWCTYGIIPSTDFIRDSCTLNIKMSGVSNTLAVSCVLSGKDSYNPAAVGTYNSKPVVATLNSQLFIGKASW